jgi:hypothetical protein
MATVDHVRNDQEEVERLIDKLLALIQQSEFWVEVEDAESWKRELEDLAEKIAFKRCLLASRKGVPHVES